LVLRFSRFGGEANLENGGPRQRGKGAPKCKKAPGAQWLREQDAILEWWAVCGAGGPYRSVHKGRKPALWWPTA